MSFAQFNDFCLWTVWNKTQKRKFGVNSNIKIYLWHSIICFKKFSECFSLVFVSVSTFNIVICQFTWGYCRKRHYSLRIRFLTSGVNPILRQSLNVCIDLFFFPARLLIILLRVVGHFTTCICRIISYATKGIFIVVRAIFCKYFVIRFENKRVIQAVTWSAQNAVK